MESKRYLAYAVFAAAFRATALLQWIGYGPANSVGRDFLS
jgi:hypothetical protein